MPLACRLVIATLCLPILQSVFLEALIFPVSSFFCYSFHGAALGKPPLWRRVSFDGHDDAAGAKDCALLLVMFTLYFLFFSKCCNGWEHVVIPFLHSGFKCSGCCIMVSIALDV